MNTETAVPHSIPVRFRATKVDRPAWLRGTATGGVALCLAALTACAGSEAETLSPWAPEIAAEYERAVPGLAKDILADGSITQEEYLQAVDEYLRCMNEQGLEIHTVKAGALFNYVVAGTSDMEADSAQYDAADAVCRPLSIGGVEALYDQLTRNPTREF